MEKKWLKWAKELQSIAQAGLEYSKDKYDIERFEMIRNISIDILSEYTEMEYDKVRDLFANEKGYQTPKVDIRAAIFRDNKILMVKEKIDGKWSLPGGWADIGISVYDNIMKESMEESGAKVKPKRVIAILDRNKHLKDEYPYSVYKIFVECDYIQGQYEKNIETEEADFFTLDNLPELSTGRNTKEHISMCFEVRKKEVHETICE